MRKAGLVILARNWRAAGGELDLAALEGETLVFIEVKSRRGEFHPDHAPVSSSQRRRIAQAARAFRSRFGVRHLPFRYDLVTVTGALDKGRNPDAVLTWHKNAAHGQEKR